MSFKCVRCGKPVGSKGGRCRSCLNKLNRNRKDPNRHEHVEKLVSDALKRQRGQKSSKQTKKTTGVGSSKEIKKKIIEGYKKYGKGTILSPDRKNNSDGYSSSNVRMVPKELNRGRHNLDVKKLNEWKNRVKKSEIDPEILQKSVIDKAYDRGRPEIAIAIEIKNFIKKILS